MIPGASNQIEAVQNDMEAIFNLCPQYHSGNLVQYSIKEADHKKFMEFRYAILNRTRSIRMIITSIYELCPRLDRLMNQRRADRQKGSSLRCITDVDITLIDKVTRTFQQIGDGINIHFEEFTLDGSNPKRFNLDTCKMLAEEFNESRDILEQIKRKLGELESEVKAIE